MGACCFCACIFKMILGILNMLLMIIGVLIAGLGGIMLAMADSSFVHETVRIIMVPILEKLFGQNYIMTSVTGSLKEFLSPISWALIVIGCILVAIAIFGYIGLSLSINLCLAIYAAIIGIIIFVQILLVALFFTGQLNAPIEKLMAKTIHEQYGGIMDNNIYTFSWNLVMLRFECCGAVNYMDFRENMQKTQPWPKNETVTIQGHNVTDVFDMPVVCCKTNGTFPNLEFYDQKCYKESRPSNNKDMGCREAIAKEIEATKDKTLIFYILALAVQFLLLIMVIVIMQENKVFGDKN